MNFLLLQIQINNLQLILHQDYRRRKKGERKKKKQPEFQKPELDIFAVNQYRTFEF